MLGLSGPLFIACCTAGLWSLDATFATVVKLCLGARIANWALNFGHHIAPIIAHRTLKIS